MKKFNYIHAICLTIVLSMVACTKLDETVYSKITIDQFFVNEQAVLQNAARAYTKLQHYPEEFSLWTLDELSSDEMAAPKKYDGSVWDGGRWNDIQQHMVQSSNKINLWAWNSVFQGIAGCNEVLYETEQSSITFPEKDRIIAEIKILRAYEYYWAMDNWGNIPFVTDFTSKELPPQKDRKFVFDFVEKEILANVDILQKVPTQAYYGRVTQGMAYTLLAKLYLNSQEWIGVDNFQKSVDACDKVIALNSYQIESNYFTNFKIKNEPSKENIFVIPYDPTLTPQLFYFFALTLNSSSAATYGMTGNSFWDEFVTEPPFIHKFADNDLRKKSFIRGQQKDLAGKNIANFIYTDTIINYSSRKKWEGARIGKYEYELSKLDYDKYDMDNDFVLFRYADVLYTKLEALYRMGRGAEMLGNADLQKIRTRAGLAPLEASDLTDTGLLDELGREFVFEGHRRQDMIRFGVWGKAGWNKPERGPNAKLFPIPQEVLNANPSLQQNPPMQN